MARWRSYSADQVIRRRADGELLCPQCGEPIRVYHHTSTRNNHKILLTQFWCTPCRLFSGSTGPLPEGFEPADDPSRICPTKSVRPWWAR